MRRRKFLSPFAASIIGLLGKAITNFALLAAVIVSACNSGPSDTELALQREYGLCGAGDEGACRRYQMLLQVYSLEQQREAIRSQQMIDFGTYLMNHGP